MQKSWFWEFSSSTQDENLHIDTKFVTVTDEILTNQFFLSKKTWNLWVEESSVLKFFFLTGYKGAQMVLSNERERMVKSPRACLSKALK